MPYTETEVLDGLAQIVAEETGLPTDAVQLGESFTDDLDVDSLSMLSILTHVEDRFGVRIPDGVMARVAIVKDVVDYVMGAQGQS